MPVNVGKVAARILLGLIVLVLIFMAFYAFTAQIVRVHARDFGQWANVDVQVKQWYQNLIRPDTIQKNQYGQIFGSSCCGEADAYYVRTRVWHGEIIATIDDDRDDTKLGRQHIDSGTEFIVPPAKIVDSDQGGNPTGHEVLFLNTSKEVVCYVEDSGS